MQVKKFEARSMKEALEMVKRELGPDAIILDARDNRRSFGLVGDVSVEITAAVTEETLHKKRFVESRMKPDVRERFQSAPARAQREIMTKFVQRYEDDAEKRPATSQRYVEIENDGRVRVVPSPEQRPMPVARSSPRISPRPTTESKPRTGMMAFETAEERIKDAAQRAWDAMRGLPKAVLKPRVSAGPAERPASVSASPPTPSPSPTPTSPAAPSPASLASSQPKEETSQLDLRSELEGLKKVISEFQKVPQTFTSHYPGFEYGLSYEFSASFEKLSLAGVDPELAGEMLEKASQSIPRIKQKSKGLIDGWTANHILQSTVVTGEKSKARVQCFVGPRGSGKTSSLIKMASRAVVESHRKIAIVTADTHKVGAIDQMRIYAQILNVPFGVVRRPKDWDSLLKQLGEYETIFCDFPGVSLREIEEISQLKALLAPLQDSECHLVVSAANRDSELRETCRRFLALEFDDFIFNHIDETVLHGCVYNMMHQFSKPLHSFGTGPRVPEDFEFATKERVLDLIFKLSKVQWGREE